MVGTTASVSSGITIYRPDTVNRRRARRWFAGLLAIAVTVGAGAFVNALQAEQGSGPSARTVDHSPFAYFPR
jgi:hypothetical protein